MIHAVILYSVGSPETLSTQSLRRFLNNFLSDRLVVKLPRFLWQPILHSFVLRTRPERMQGRYQKIFVGGYNPYLKAMEHLCVELEQHLNDAHDLQNTASAAQQQALESLELATSSLSGDLFIAETSATAAPAASATAANDESASASAVQFMVRAAYAYMGTPLKQQVDQCLQSGATHITVIPLFPQYSDTTSKRPLLELQELARRKIKAKLSIVRSYADHPLYIKALATTLQQSLQQVVVPLSGDGNISSMLKESKTQIIFTYHGLPQSYIKMGDPYPQEVKTTTYGLASTLQLQESDYMVAFQSRMGPMPWMRPYLEDCVDQALEAGKQHLIVIAPGFALDCLETLYDLDIKLKERFLHRGGESFTYIKALNDSTAQIELLAALLSTAEEVKG